MEPERTYSRAEIESELQISETQLERWIGEGLVPGADVAGRHEYRAGVDRPYPARTLQNAWWVKTLLDGKLSFSEIRIWLWLIGLIETDLDRLKPSLAEVSFGWLHAFLDTPRLKGDESSRLTTVLLRKADDPFFIEIERSLGNRKRRRQFAQVVAGLVLGRDLGFSVFDDPTETPLSAFMHGTKLLFEAVLRSLRGSASRAERREFEKVLEEMRPTIIEMMLNREFSMHNSESRLDKAGVAELERAGRSVHLMLHYAVRTGIPREALHAKYALRSWAMLTCYFLIPELGIAVSKYLKRHVPELQGMKYNKR